jgi:hypothetical protein
MRTILPLAVSDEPVSCVDKNEFRESRVIDGEASLLTSSENRIARSGTRLNISYMNLQAGARARETGTVLLKQYIV